MGIKSDKNFIGIVSFNELIFAAENILKNLNQSNLCMHFKEIMESRENSRRKNSIFFRPPTEMKYDDSIKFNASFNESYKKIPGSYPVLKNCTTDQIAIDNINILFVSASPGSEKNTSKKPYEEGVLKKHF